MGVSGIASHPIDLFISYYVNSDSLKSRCQGGIRYQSFIGKTAVKDKCARTGECKESL